MNKNLLRLVSLLMAAILLFIGCAKPAENKDEATTNTEQADEKKSESNEEIKDEKETVSEEKPNFDGRTLNVVATSDKYVKLFDEFTKETGAKVEFLSMSSGEVIARTKAEGKPMADLWFGGGLDAFMAADGDGLLEHYISPNASDVNEAYKDSNGAWIAKGLTVAGFLVNHKILEEKGLEIPKTWEEIADPKYKGEVIMSNPAVSGTNYAVVKGLLDLFGEEAGWDYISRLNDNIDFYGKRGKDPQEKTAAGEFAIGIIPVDKSAFDVATEQDLTVVYPEDGIPWVPEGVAIFKNSDNTDIAKAFVDFMLTKDAQQMIAELDGKDSAQIIKPDVDGLDLGLPEDKLIKEDLSTFGSKRDEILAKFAEISSGKTE
ncbi:MAG: ABC transporter substrate-binding protein [Firmicutes bacterium]|nr:ABC transporter substrate-binding protein [Bacillota bacterium]